MDLANDDDEEPPMLVDARDVEEPSVATLSTEMEDVQITKVPITIITGKAESFPLSCLNACTIIGGSRESHDATGMPRDI